MNEFVFFECGFRLCGGHLYNYFTELGLNNNLDIFIFHALLGDLSSLPKPKEGNQKLKCVAVNLYAKKGTVAKIEGVQEIESLNDCKLALIQAHIGQQCKDDKAILSKLGMFHFISESSNLIKKDIDYLYENIKIKSEDNEDMIYDYLDSQEVAHWWD